MPIFPGSQGRGRLSQEDVARLSEQIAGLSEAALPLPSGLRALAEEQPSRRLRGLLKELSGSLEAGTPLEVALADQCGRLPGHVRGLVLAGLRSGRLGEVLGRFVTYANVGLDLRRRLWLSLSYPLIAWAVALCLVGFVLVALAGNFGELFRGFGIRLPLLSRVMITMSEAITRFGSAVAWLAGLVAVFVLVVALASNGPRRRSLASRIPLIGRVWRFTSLAEFCHLLALLLECDVPLGEALALTGEGVADADVDRACRAMVVDVGSGLSLAQAVYRRQLFPTGLARVLEWAEGHHGLPEALHMSGEMFESRARAHAAFTSIVCSVLTVIVILLGVVFVIGAVLIPMITLIRALSG
jgi:general secretion pathway protein F